MRGFFGKRLSYNDAFINTSFEFSNVAIDAKGHSLGVESFRPSENPKLQIWKLIGYDPANGDSKSEKHIEYFEKLLFPQNSPSPQLQNGDNLGALEELKCCSHICHRNIYCCVNRLPKMVKLETLETYRALSE